MDFFILTHRKSTFMSLDSALNSVSSTLPHLDQTVLKGLLKDLKNRWSSMNDSTHSTSSKTHVKKDITHSTPSDIAVDQALEYQSLSHMMRTHHMSLEGYQRIGRWMEQIFKKKLAPSAQLKVCLLGQFNTHWLKHMLMAEACERNIWIEVIEAEYDQVLQSSMQEIYADFVVCLPCSVKIQHMFLTQSKKSQTTIDTLDNSVESIHSNDLSSNILQQELVFWQSVWNNLQHNAKQAGYKQSIIQVGHTIASSMAQNLMAMNAQQGLLHCIQSVNQVLRLHLPQQSYFLDLSYLAAQFGHHHFYSARNYHWTKDIFTHLGAYQSAKAIWAGIRTLHTGPKKVLVLDLDHTLWGGVVGEEGALGIHIGQDVAGSAYYDFQLACKALQAQGVLLAVCSKNNLADAQAPFLENPEMILQLKDFVAFKANWQPKAHNIKEISLELNLGLDSFVFVDDHPAERTLVREMLPMVEVVELPKDPAGYIQALSVGLWFESLALTAEDMIRTQQYQAETSRTQLKQNLHSLDSYLSSLQMKAQVSEIQEIDFTRVMQLIGKTNQFNLTTYRHSADYVHQLCQQKGAVALSVRAQDRFGDYGLISVLLARPQPQNTKILYLDTWLMSCRVIARTVEEFCFNQFIKHAQNLGYEKIYAYYRPSAKNQLIADLLTRMQFISVNPDQKDEYMESTWLSQLHDPNSADTNLFYALSLSKFTPLIHFIQS
jgi:FkbH-like protein